MILNSFKWPLLKLTFGPRQVCRDQSRHPNPRRLANSHLARSVDSVSTIHSCLGVVGFDMPRRGHQEKEQESYNTLDPSSGGNVSPNPLLPLHPTDAPVVISFIADRPAPYSHGLMNPMGGLFCAMRAALTCPTMPAQIGAAALSDTPHQLPSSHTNSQALNPG